MPNGALFDDDDGLDTDSPDLNSAFLNIPYEAEQPLSSSPTPISPASSSAATIPPPSPGRPADPPGLAVPPALNVPRLPALLDAVAKRSTELVRLRRTLQVEAQRLSAARAAAGCGGNVGGGGEDVVQGEDCPICLEKLLAPTAVLARCGHMFHRHCIEQHLAHRRLAGCPICRANMHRAELVQVMSGIPEAGESEGGRGPNVEQAATGKKEEAVVVCLDDDGEEVIDLVDPPGSGDEAGGGDGGGASGGPSGSGELRGLSRALEGALAAVEKELVSSRVVPEIVALVEQERDLLQTQWKTELANVKKEQETVMSDWKKERRAVRAEVADLKHRTEEVRQKEAEVNDELSRAKKLRNDLDIMKKQLDVREKELQLDRANVNDEQLECLREKKRYEALVTSRQRKEKAKEESQRELDKLKEGVSRKRRKVMEDVDLSDEGSFSDEVSLVEVAEEEVKISGLRSKQSPAKRGSLQLPEKPLELFGSQLQKPSTLNRPAAPRRGSGGLSLFAPKRSKVQRPSSGIGSRPRRK